MNRRSFLKTSPAVAAAAAAHLGAQTPDFGKSKLKITGIRLSVAKPRTGTFNYKPAPGSWSTQDVEVANPMSIYPKYKATRSLFNPDPGKLEDFAVEITTDKGISGYGIGGAAGGVLRGRGPTQMADGGDPFRHAGVAGLIWVSPH